MGKYENMMKCAQIRSLANDKQYNNAHDVLQTLNVNQITAIADLNTIADVYIQLKKYSEAKDVYLRLYDKIQTRRVLYQLVYLSIKCGEMEDAEAFLEDYEKIDKSVDRIILRYYIDKTKGVDREVLIGHLQQLKKEEYIEEWAYELAKLYHKEGMEQECVAECSDIILWFGEGLIVEKAMLLRHHYVDGADISSEKAIMRETKNLAAELKIAAAIAERNERIKARRKAELLKQAKNQATNKSVSKSLNIHNEDVGSLDDEQFIEELTQNVERQLVQETMQKQEIEFEKKSEKEIEDVFAKEKIESVDKQEDLIQTVEEKQTTSYIESKKIEQKATESFGKMKAKEELKQALARLYGGIKSITESRNEEVYEKETVIEQKNVQEEVSKQENVREEIFKQEKVEQVFDKEIIEKEEKNDWQEEISLTEINIEEPDNKIEFFKQPKKKMLIKIETTDTATKLQEKITNMISDMKMQKEVSHIAIMSDDYDKNVELGKSIAKELYRQQVLQSSKIARIHAGKLGSISLQDNRHKLLDSCLLVEQASIISLDSMQNLYQFMNRSKGKVVVIFYDTKVNMGELLKKNRKLESLIHYHIEI